MQLIYTNGVLLALFVFLLSMDSPVGAQSYTTLDEAAVKRVATKIEREWLEHEIGRFSSGRFEIFAGDLKVTQRDPNRTTVVEGRALATLSPHPPHSLTVSFPAQEQWFRLTQNPDNPDLTSVTRLRVFSANEGVSATCSRCVVQFEALAEDFLFLRLTARGELLDVGRSRFVVQVAGSLQHIPPETLSLDQISSLSPDFATWLRRPDAPFIQKGNEGVRDVMSMLSQRAASPGGDTVRFTCHHEINYTAQHYVDLSDLTRIGVRDLELGETQLCCVDHALHDGSKFCAEENKE